MDAGEALVTVVVAHTLGRDAPAAYLALGREAMGQAGGQIMAPLALTGWSEPRLWPGERDSPGRRFAMQQVRPRAV